MIHMVKSMRLMSSSLFDTCMGGSAAIIIMVIVSLFDNFIIINDGE